jgi:hypothetical protein
MYRLEEKHGKRWVRVKHTALKTLVQVNERFADTTLTWADGYDIYASWPHAKRTQRAVFVRVIH